MDAQDPFALNIRGVTDLVENKLNKVSDGNGANIEGVASEKRDTYAIDLTDEELLKLRDLWEKNYAGYEARLKVVVSRNLESYLGKRKDGQWLVDGGPIAANLQFEAEETFLAATLSKNADPVVYSDNTPEGNAIATSVKTMLAFHADQLALRRKLTIMVRQWSIYHLGVLKHGWNKVINDVSIENRKIQDFIFDPNGYVNAYGDFIGYLGERITVTADKLIDMFPEHSAYIKLATDDKLGTDVIYTEWWSPDDEYTFTTFKDKILDKTKNPNFKYPEVQTDLLGQPVTDPLTNAPAIHEPRNHFAVPKKPYTFLSVYSLQEQPHDITGLIEQNIANQNRIAKRTEQITYNADSSNNGYAYNEANFNQETAKQASVARAKGNPILIPQGGPISEAILPLPAQALPASFFDELQVSKDDLRSSWGVQGIASQKPNEDQTARGMILNQSHDTSRIGGGIGDALEQVADNVFNWLVQLYHVYYDEQHFAAIMGQAKAVEYVTLSGAQIDRQLIVSVAPDSLKPKDEITEINQAVQYFEMGVIGPKTLLTIASFPSPDESAADGLMYKLDPMGYFQLNFPQYAAQLQQMQMQNAQAAAAQGAQAEGMKTAAVAANTPPELPSGDTTNPKNTALEPASAALSQVPLPQ